MSTGVGMSACCLSGSVHEGTPTGKVETIDNLQTYVAAPKDGSKAKSIVFLVDIFGWEFKNVRLLADSYAKSGFYCYIPDVHQGDSLPIDFLQSVEPPLKVREDAGLLAKAKSTFDVGTTLMPWLAKHPESTVKPLIDSFISTVKKTPGTGKVGALGFCWGGRYAILAAGTAGAGEVDAAVACHPSLVTVPGDFDPISKPISLAVGDQDSLLDQDTVKKIQDLLAKKTLVPNEVKVYNDQIHGFALRSDWSSEKDRKAMDESEQQGKDWFEKHLS